MTDVQTIMASMRASIGRATPGPLEVVPYGDGDSLVIHVAGTDHRICFMATPSISRDMRHIEGNADLIVEAWRHLPALLDRIEALEEAMTKISAIRDSIVGMQGFNFSEHAYPLVAALDAAGFEGAGYEISRKNLGTLIEQIKASEARVAELEAALGTSQIGEQP